MDQSEAIPGGQRKYSYLLRPIGAFLDTLDARYITVAEIADGFIWHCYRNRDPSKCVSGVIPHDNIPALIEMTKRDKQARARANDAIVRVRKSTRGLFRRRSADADSSEVVLHPVCPDGYEESLRSVGAKLDDQRAYMIMLVEREASMVIRYSMPLPPYIRVDISRPETFTGFHEVEYSTDEINEIIDTIRDRRGIPYYQ
jgi:hypothetical protein